MRAKKHAQETREKTQKREEKKRQNKNRGQWSSCCSAGDDWLHSAPFSCHFIAEIEFLKSILSRSQIKMKVLIKMQSSFMLLDYIMCWSQALKGLTHQRILWLDAWVFPLISQNSILRQFGFTLPQPYIKLFSCTVLFTDSNVPPAPSPASAPSTICLSFCRIPEIFPNV